MSIAYDTLLVPLDGSPFGEHALPYAIAIARRTGGRIDLVHAHALPPEISILSLDPGWDEEQREQEREYLDEIAERVAAEGVPVETRLLGGPAVAAIQADAEERDADLIVMSTHGRTGLERAWIGSVADGVVRQVGIPVLLIRPDSRPEVARVRLRHAVVPLDGSALAERILPAVEALVPAGLQRVTLVRVIPRELLVGGHVFHLDEARRIELESKAHEYVDRVGRRIAGAGLEVDARTVTHESPAAAIHGVATDTRADLVAMTTHGHGGLKRLLIGSTADKMLRSAAIPLLLYRPDAREA